MGEGRSTISAALSSKKYRLKSICDRNEELCRQRAKEFDFHNVTTDYNDLLNDNEIDVIAIYTPDHLHAEHIKQALLHGKHVVCTKPFIDDLQKQKSCWTCRKNRAKKFLWDRAPVFLNRPNDSERISKRDCWAN